MSTITENPAQATAPAKGIAVTDKAVARIRSAMEKEGISPAEVDCALVCREADAQA